MAFAHSDLKMLDPSQGAWVDLDGGGTATFAVLFAILTELRVHTMYLQAMNPGILTDDVAQLRADVASDPASIIPFTATSNF